MKSPRKKRRIVIRYSHWAFKLPGLRNYRGIVVGNRIWFKDAEGLVSPELLRHEMIHQEQIERHSVLWFYLIYFKHYVLNLFKYRNHHLAYRNIPFELEAYSKEDERRPLLKNV